MSKHFEVSKQNLNLKLVLLNALEDFDESVSSAFHTALEKFTDRQIVELILDSKNEENKSALIYKVLHKCISVNPPLKEILLEKTSLSFQNEYKIK